MVILETGLGGRLDATNVIRIPALLIITSIGLAHTRILEDTIQLSAVENGWNSETNCPVLMGTNVPHSTSRQCAEDKGASHYNSCKDAFQLLDDNDDDKRKHSINGDAALMTGDNETRY